MKEKIAYKVWATQGQGECLAEAFTQLRYALDYAEEHKGEASFAIQYPDGRIHNWNDEETPPT